MMIIRTRIPMQTARPILSPGNMNWRSDLN